jgi:D-psicose/D-tagatose/L-ribulose 3-epimerase
MPRFGAHAFVWESEWTPDAARRVVRAAAEAGLDFVELPLLRPAEVDVDDTLALLREHGIGCTCSLGLPPDATLPDDPEAAEAFLRGAIDVTGRLGSTVLSGVIYGTLGTLVGRPPRDEDYVVIARSLGRVARYAAPLGISLGIEPVNRYETYLVNIARQGLDLIERIAEPNVFLHLDTYHMNIEERGFRGPIVEAGRHLRYIHLSESDRGTPGEGNVHWDDVFSGLAAIGYDGDLVMESFVALNPDIARATCMWRSVVDDPARLVRDGLAFLRAAAERHGLPSAAAAADGG